MENQSVEQSVQVGIAEINLYQRPPYAGFVSIGFLAATVLSHLAIRAKKKLAADETRPPSGFALLVSLTLTAAVAMFMTFAPAG